MSIGITMAMETKPDALVVVMRPTKIVGGWGLQNRLLTERNVKGCSLRL